MFSKFVRKILFVRNLGICMKKQLILVVAALLLSAASVYLAAGLLNNRIQGPYFIDSAAALEADVEMQAVNQKIAAQDAILKKEEQVFNDSLMKLLDSLSVRRGEEESLMELINLESNVFRHKKIDSIGKATHDEVAIAIEHFNGNVKVYCEKAGIPVLFGSNNNTVVYGTGKKSDKTKELVTFLGNK